MSSKKKSPVKKSSQKTPKSSQKKSPSGIIPEQSSHAAPVFQEIGIDQIVKSKTNPRKHSDKDSLKDLTESIKTKGVLQPVLVRVMKDGKFELICGSRRLEASKAAGLKTIPAIIRDLSDREVVEVQVIENLQREDVHPLEEAEGYESLIAKYGYAGVDEIAARVGKSKGYVYQRLKLCDLIQPARKAFYEGIFSTSIAYLIARVPQQLQPKLLEELQGWDWDHRTLTVSDVKHKIESDFMYKLSDAPFKANDPDLGEVACDVCPKNSGNQNDLFGDIKGNVCTDPECFFRKRLAFSKRQVEKAKESGLTILSASDAKKYFNNPYGSEYEDLNNRCYEDPKGRNYMALLKKDQLPGLMAVAVDDRGLVKHLARKSDLLKALKENGYKFAEKAEKDDEKSKSIEKKEKQRKKVFKKTCEELIRLSVERIASDQGFAKIQSVVDEVIDLVHFDSKKLFCAIRGHQVKAHEVEETVKSSYSVIKTSPEQAMNFCLELLLCHSVANHWGDEYPEFLSSMCQALNINVQSVEEQVKNDVISSGG